MKSETLRRSCQSFANSRFISIDKNLLHLRAKFCSDNAIGIAERLTAK